MGLDAVVHVIADPDSEVLSDTASDPDLGARVDHVVQEEESDRNSSGDDSVVDDREAHDAVGDVFVPDTVWDELIIDRATRAADLVSLFKSRASVMKSPPKLLVALTVRQLRVALTEADLGYAAGDDARVSRALPRMLLHKPVRGGLVPKGKLKERFNLFTQGRWEDLIFASQQCDADALKVSSRRRRTQQGDSVEKRADRASDLIQMGELSAARHALEGDLIAPGNRQTLNALQDPESRPPVPREALPASIINHFPQTEIDLDQDRFLANLRSARRRAAGGPSGMTAEHIKATPWRQNETALHCGAFRVSTGLHVEHSPGRQDWPDDGVA